MDRADAAHSGYTSEQLPATISLRWTAREPHPPAAAWPSIDRMPFDRANRVVAAGGRALLWHVRRRQGRGAGRGDRPGLVDLFTDAPVRFAPAVWQDRVLVASDDGFLYCLNAADGRRCGRSAAVPGPTCSWATTG